MLPIRYQRSPLSGAGARLYGGCWNGKGTAALYLATDPATAVDEFYQGLPKPGTLAPYRLEAGAIADLTDGAGGPRDASVEHALVANWKAMAARGDRTPPSWALTAELIEAGAQGALVPSAQNRGGVCMVLWHWHDARQGKGDGAAHPARSGGGTGLGLRRQTPLPLFGLMPDRAPSVPYPNGARRPLS